MKQAELVAKLPKQAPIALLTVNRLLVRFGEESTQKEPKATAAQAAAEQSHHTLISVDASAGKTNGAADLT